MTRSMARFGAAALVALAAALGSLACGGGDGDADADADTDTVATPVRFVFHFVSDVPESVWVDATFPWSLVRVTRGETVISLENWCACDCGECPGCMACDEPCPSVLEVPNGGQAEYQWNGLETVSLSCPAEPSSHCNDQVAAPAGSYVARFCWGTSVDGSLECGEGLLGTECVEVPFELPDADGVVEHTLNWGG